MMLGTLSEAKRKLLESYIQGDRTPTFLGPRLITTGRFDGPAPLSLSQEQLLLRERSAPDIPPLYNECITLRMSGPLDVRVLERSLTEIIRRHEIWRTSYETRNGRMVQIVHSAPTELRLPVMDLRGLPAAEQEMEVQHEISEAVRQHFDLTNGPLLRARLVTLGRSEYRLYLIAHLSIVDGVSVYQVFPSELAALYGGYTSAHPVPLPSPAIQFGDYASWQRQWLQGEELDKQVAYWRKQLAGRIPALRWPTERCRLRKQTFRGAMRPFVLSPTVSKAVKELSQREAVTLFMTLLAAFVGLLHCYTQQDDIVVGTLSPAGRKRSEVAKLLGYFLNPVALRFDLTSDPTFHDLLLQAQRLTLEAISNDDVPIEFLAQELKLKHDLSHNPFFNVAISLQPPMPPLDLEWNVTSMDVEGSGSPWDLYIAFIDGPEQMMCRVQYNPDLFESGAICRVLRHYQRLLENVCAKPVKHLSELNFLFDK